MKKIKDMTPEERRDYFHNYYLAHRQKYIERAKQWNKENQTMTKEEYKEYRHQNYIKHKTARTEYQKMYYREHKSEILKKHRNRYRIKCGLKAID